MVKPSEQRALPILEAMTPRRQDPTMGGSVGARRQLDQPVYVPAAVEDRPYADEIRA